MRRAFPRCGRLPALASVGATLGLVIYLLLLVAAMPRQGLGGGLDRPPGIVFARYRQAQFDVVADHRPAPRPHAPVLPPACLPAVFAAEATGCSTLTDARTDLVEHLPSPGTPRSPPAS
jgi:hypothetical protein